MSQKKEKKQKTWWPHHVVGAGTLIVIFLSVLFYLAKTYPIPDDAPAIIPMPDDGANIPGPEWFFLLLWQPFWHYVGMRKKYLVFTALVPIIFFIYLALLPFVHKIPFHRIPGVGIIFRKIREMKDGFIKKSLYVGPIVLITALLLVGIVKSGYQAKLHGCESCHNAANGQRMYIPPKDVAEYYKVDRARQIKVGKYRAGKSVGLDEKGRHIYDVTGTQSYKDSNWQMRHMYEPTFTW